MASYAFHLIGSPERLVLDVDAATLADLGERMIRNRFVVGRIDDPQGPRAILVPTCRIQVVTEAD